MTLKTGHNLEGVPSRHSRGIVDPPSPGLQGPAPLQLTAQPRVTLGRTEENKRQSTRSGWVPINNSHTGGSTHSVKGPEVDFML